MMGNNEGSDDAYPFEVPDVLRYQLDTLLQLMQDAKESGFKASLAAR